MIILKKIALLAFIFSTASTIKPVIFTHIINFSSYEVTINNIKVVSGDETKVRTQTISAKSEVKNIEIVVPRGTELFKTIGNLSEYLKITVGEKFFLCVEGGYQNPLTKKIIYATWYQKTNGKLRILTESYGLGGLAGLDKNREDNLKITLKINQKGVFEAKFNKK